MPVLVKLPLPLLVLRPFPPVPLKSSRPAFAKVALSFRYSESPLPSAIFTVPWLSSVVPDSIR